MIRMFYVLEGEAVPSRVATDPMNAEL